MEDEKWIGLEGGYRGCQYDPRPALTRLRAGDESAWTELWNELHHQGDVGLASYAVVPQLVRIHRDRDIPDWQTYALIGTIEVCRQAGGPALPEWIEAEYTWAWNEIIPLAFRDLSRVKDENSVRSIIGAIALATGLRLIGEIVLHFDSDQISEMLRLYAGR